MGSGTIRSLSFATLLGVVGLWAVESICWGEVVSIEDFLVRIDGSLVRLEAGQGPLESPDASWLQERFPEGMRVRDGEGSGVRLDRGMLLHWVREAQGSPEGRGRLIVYLKSVRTQLAGEVGQAGQGEGDWRTRLDALDEVYRAREFRHLRERGVPDWFSPLVDFLRSLVQWLNEQLGALRGVPGKWIQNIAFGIIVILGILLILWIVRAFGPVGWARRSPRSGSVLAVRTKERDWASWREEAFERARRGGFREAVRCLFISVLLEGHQKGWWVYEAQATNREHLARLTHQPQRRQAMERLVEVYERVWYGLGRSGEEEFRACESWARRLEEPA